MPIKIVSSKDGFRRCGVAHSKETTVYKDGKFTTEQTEILKGESMLMVEIIKPERTTPQKDTKESLMKLTVAELKVIGDKLNCTETTKEKLVDEILAAQKKGN